MTRSYDINEQVEETLRTNIKELQQRLIEKTNAFMEQDTKKVYRIRELETAIGACLHQCYKDSHYKLPGEVMAGLSFLHVALKKNKEHYQ